MNTNYARTLQQLQQDMRDLEADILKKQNEQEQLKAEITEKEEVLKGKEQLRKEIQLKQKEVADMQVTFRSIEKLPNEIAQKKSALQRIDNEMKKEQDKIKDYEREFEKIQKELLEIEKKAHNKH